MNTSYLRVDNISKSYGAVKALRDVSFEAGQGEFLSILGPSGCGKTTALRVIAGLEMQSRGQVFINGRDVSGLGVSKRNVGIVFQSYALFPNITAAGNIAYGLTGQLSKSEIETRVKDLMILVGLKGLGHKYPAQLSGGQQQRVALARAMALSPDLLLLDEPLSALDAKVRVKLRSEIRNLQQRLGVTTIMVTHDQEEALTMADQILVMNSGRLIQKGSPTQIYESPATPFVASFIGSMNFMERARKVNTGMYEISGKTVEVKNENGAGKLGPGHEAVLAIRPEDVSIHTGDPSCANAFPGQIRTMEYRGSIFRIGLTLDSETTNSQIITADVPTPEIRRLSMTESMPVQVSLPGERLLVYESGLSAGQTGFEKKKGAAAHG